MFNFCYDIWHACDIFCICYCVLTLFHDSSLLSAAKVCHRSHFVHLFIIMTCFWFVITLVSIDFLTNCHVCFILLVETHFSKDLEGCYGLYRIFPISNLTPEPDPIFHRPTFPNKESHLGFLFLILFTL